MAAIATFPIAALSLLGTDGAIWQNDSKAIDAVKLNLYKSAKLTPKWVKGDLRSCHQNVQRLFLFRKNTFPFSCVQPCGYNNVPNKGTITFFAKFGPISPSP